MASVVTLDGANVRVTPLANFPQDKREIHNAFQRVIAAVQELQTIVDGITVPNLSTGTVTFSASTTSTVINDTAIGVNSVVVLSPMEQDAVSLDSWWYQGTTAAGSVTMEHSNMSVTRDFRYLVAG